MVKVSEMVQNAFWSKVEVQRTGSIADLEAGLAAAIAANKEEEKASKAHTDHHQVVGRVHWRQGEGSPELNSIGRLLPDGTKLYAKPEFNDASLPETGYVRLTQKQYENLMAAAFPPSPFDRNVDGFSGRRLDGPKASSTRIDADELMQIQTVDGGYLVIGPNFKIHIGSEQVDGKIIYTAMISSGEHKHVGEAGTPAHALLRAAARWDAYFNTEV